MGPVVTGEKDDGVFRDAQLVQLVEDSPDIGVQPLDHRCHTLFRRGPVFSGEGTVIGNLHAVAGSPATLVIGVGNRVGKVEEEGSLVIAFQESEGALGKKIMGVGATLAAEVSPQKRFDLVCPQVIRIEVVGVNLAQVPEELIESLEVGPPERTPGRRRPIFRTSLSGSRPFSVPRRRLHHRAAGAISACGCREP